MSTFILPISVLNKYFISLLISKLEITPFCRVDLLEILMKSTLFLKGTKREANGGTNSTHAQNVVR